MAVQTFTYLRNYVQSYFLENYDEEITAQHLRTFLTDLLDSLEAITSVEEDQIRRGSQSVSTAGTTITFDLAFDDTNYIVIGKCTSGNNKILYQEYDYTASNFKVKPVANAIFKYIAIPLS